MQHQDAEVSDITVVLKKECAEKFDETIAALRKLEMEIEETDVDNGVVSGTISADKLPHIKSWPCVEYARVDFTYIAEHPVGDAQNQDPAEEESVEPED